MAQNSSIQWTEQTWNPVTGCSKVSPGCKNCYAETIANRFWGDRKFTSVQCHEDRLEQPLKRKKPTMYFVNSMSDLFHEDVPDEFIDKVFAVMALAKQHTFQVLTKRPERMADYFDLADRHNQIELAAESVISGSKHILPRLPLSNVWLGTSVENQEQADKRIPHLLKAPAAVRFLSCEPLLAELNIAEWLYSPHDKMSMDNIYISPLPGTKRAEGWFNKINWVIVGGESGPDSRPCNIQWIYDLVEQCLDAGTPCFVKQLGSKPYIRSQEDAWGGVLMPYCLSNDDYPGYIVSLKDPKGGDMSEWPEDLRVREFPL